MTNSANSTRQQEIKEWFDKTYTRRGESYLRPVKAYYIFLELLKVKPGERILDVACGLGRLLEAAKQYKCKSTGVDISEVAIKKIKDKSPEMDVHCANAENLPFEEGQFEYVTCLGSLERMLDMPTVFNQMQRVTTQDAKFCFLVRNDNTSSWNFKKALGIENKKGHQGAKSYKDWANIFDEGGFEIIDVVPDQYPLHKKLKYKSLGLKKVDYKKVVEDGQSIEKANEFIFILKKK